MASEFLWDFGQVNTGGNPMKNISEVLKEILDEVEREVDEHQTCGYISECITTSATLKEPLKKILEEVNSQWLKRIEESIPKERKGSDFARETLVEAASAAEGFNMCRQKVLNRIKEL